ncbi:MAG: membrane dipeptidase [Dehalococcoidia bacterium]
MKRREFVRTAALAGVATGVAKAARPLSGAIRLPDEFDRSLERDPREILDSTLVVDGYSGGPMSREYVERLRAGGINCKVGRGQNLFPDEFAAATSVRDILRIHAEGKIGQVHCTDAMWLGDDHLQPYGDPTPPLAEYRAEGLMIMGLSYNIANAYGAGCLEPQIPLSLAGRRLVEEAHKQRILLDVGGHNGERTTLDAITIAPGVPVCNTHGNVRRLNDNRRCNSDRILEAIASTGGVVGITSFSDFMVRNPSNQHLPVTPQATMDQFIDQFEYVRDLVGIEHVGLGTDNVCDGESRPCPPEGQNRLVMPSDVYGEQWTYVRGYESIADTPQFVAGLIARSWSTADIRKVLGENWLRVYGEVWGG